MNHNHRKSYTTRGWKSLAAFLLCALAVQAHAQNAVETWAGGKYASGNWLGLRDNLEEHGIVFSGSWKGTFYGIVDGGLQQRGAFDEEIRFGLKLDFEKLAGITGLSAFGSVRWRDGQNPDAYVGASPAFNPSYMQVGKQWRFMPMYLTWESRNLLPVTDMITLSGGWQNPYDFFLQQPESKLFVNNAITQTKGITANGIPFNGSYAAWGGYAKIKPTSWSYLQGGLYAAVPEATNTTNHGLYFALAQPAYRNGLYALAEAGVTPKLGSAQLPGKYAFGGYYWGLENRSFNGQPYDGKYGFYWQADQMIFREPSPQEPAPLGKGPSDGKSVAGKSFKEPVGDKPKLSEQGLYFFSMLNYAPSYDNSLPLYFQTGLVYKGLIPTRDFDQLGVAFGFGSYSYDKILAERNVGNPIHQTMEGVLEFDYRVQVTKFAYVQPFLQYLIRPNGTGLVENATILGLHMGVTF